MNSYDRRRTIEGIVFFIMAIGFLVFLAAAVYQEQSTAQDRPHAPAQDHPHVAQIAELRDQITQMRQQLIVVTAKFEGKPQSCGVNDWLTFDGRK